MGGGGGTTQSDHQRKPEADALASGLAVVAQYADDEITDADIRRTVNRQIRQIGDNPEAHIDQAYKTLGLYIDTSVSGESIDISAQHVLGSEPLGDLLEILTPHELYQAVIAAAETGGRQQPPEDLSSAQTDVCVKAAAAFLDDKDDE